MPEDSQPNTILAATEPATSRWISEATARHSGTLLVYLAILGVGRLVGARIDARAYLVLVVWIGVNLIVAPWAARPHEYVTRLRRYALTLAIDVVFLGAVYYFIDAAQWLGAVFFIHSAIVASATLPRRWATAIAALIVVVFGLLVWVAVAGSAPVHSPVGLPPVTGNYAWAFGSMAAAIGLIVVLMMLQLRLVETIRDAEQRYLLLVQSAPDMVMTFDQRGHFLEVNPATLTQAGYTWEEIKQLPNTSFFPPEDWPKIMDARARTLAGEIVEMDVRFVRRSGEVRWAQTRSASFRRSGESTALLVLARDITEVKRQTDACQTDALRDNDERFRLIVSALDLGFYTIDTEGRLTAIYGGWADQQRAAGKALIGSAAIELVPPESAEQHRDANLRALAGEDVTFHWSVIPPEGAPEQFYRAHLAPMRDAGGAIVGVAGVWTDETASTLAALERETLRSRLADAERIESLGKLVSGVAHELNNPLAAILNFTEDLLADQRAGDERMALEVIQAQALRSRTIVRDLLTFVRKGDRRLRKPETPGPIIETLVRAVRPGLATQGVSFSATVEDPETPLVLDRAGFEQVITNLLTNAAQSAGAGGAVRLVARRSGDSYDVIIEDNGAGIPDDHVARIFEPFFTTKATGQGVGLGLSVSLGIVQAHDGVLLAENRGAAAGGGARFTMRLPFSSTHEARPPLPKVLIPMPPRSASLLIIDDEEPIRRALRRYFERRGWVVEEATDGADGVVKLERPDAEAVFDVVLCDLKMPGISGQELYNRLLKDRQGLARKFIFATGDAGAPDVADFLRECGVPVLEKPFELRALEEVAIRVREGTATA
ncbi:MAG: hybrid sensor histidine kinase/response regulator [Gemmatimonadaceae bacterium]